MKPCIVLLLPVFPQISETFIVNKFLGLLEHGWDVHVVCSRKNIKDWEKFSRLNQKTNLNSRVHVSWLTEPKWLAGVLFPAAILSCLFTNPGGTLRYLSLGWKLHHWGILKRFYSDAKIIALKPHLVHFEFGATAVGRADINHLLGCKEVVSFRGYDLNFSGIGEEGYYKDVWQRADGFHFLSQYLHTKAITRGLPDNKPVTLISPAVDFGFFTPPGKVIPPITGTSDRPLRLLSVGRLEWIKGYEYSFQAIKRLMDMGIIVDYRIIGSGSYLRPLVFARHQLNLDDCVTFLGAREIDRIKEELAWADVFLHPAVSEGFCNAVIEAQAMQVPVVCSDAGGLPENVEEGVTGFIVPRRDPKALAKRLIQLAKAPELRQMMGKKGRGRVLKLFTLQEQMDRFDSFYKDTLKRA